MVVVSDAGTVYAVAPGADRITVVRAGVVERSRRRRCAAGPALQITTVGDDPVVLDPAGGVLWSPGHRLTVADAVRGSAAAERTVVGRGAGGDRRCVVPDQPRRTARRSRWSGSFARPAGTPHAPIWARGCGYGLWTGNVDQAVRGCRGVPAELEPLDGDLGEAYLADRGDDVVVVSPGDGRSWLASDGFRLVDNWADVVPPDVADPDKTDQAGRAGQRPDPTAAAELRDRSGR